MTSVDMATVQGLVDKLEIQDVIQKLLFFVDGREWDKVVTIMCDEILYTPHWGPSKTITRDEYVHMVAKRFGPELIMQHFTTSAVIELSGDEAEAICYIRSTHDHPGGSSDDRWELGGRYVIGLARDDTYGWRINRKKNEVFWTVGTAPASTEEWCLPEEEEAVPSASS